MSASYLTFSKWWKTISGLAVLALVTLVISLLLGSSGINVLDAFRGDEKSHSILFMARLPRTLLAAFVGMALASAGASFQVILKNPLADPFILGVSGGAALGSVLGIGLRLPFTALPVIGFFGAILSAAFIYWVSSSKKRFSATELLLTGVIFNAFCFALILFVNAIVTMEESYQILFLLIGNLEEMNIASVFTVGIFVVIGFVILLFESRKMNLLMLGDTEARSLGVDADRLRAKVFFASSLMVGAAVAASGLIGFVGLFVPHIIRRLFGSDLRLLIPASGIFGALFLVAADALARTLLVNTSIATELPVGVVTALFGAPFFFFILRKLH